MDVYRKGKWREFIKMTTENKYKKLDILRYVSL